MLVQLFWGSHPKHTLDFMHRFIVVAIYKPQSTTDLVALALFLSCQTLAQVTP